MSGTGGNNPQLQQVIMASTQGNTQNFTYQVRPGVTDQLADRNQFVSRSVVNPNLNLDFTDVVQNQGSAFANEISHNQGYDQYKNAKSKHYNMGHSQNNTNVMMMSGGSSSQNNQRVARQQHRTYSEEVAAAPADYHAVSALSQQNLKELKKYSGDQNLKNSNNNNQPAEQRKRHRHRKVKKRRHTPTSSDESSSIDSSLESQDSNNSSQSRSRSSESKSSWKRKQKK